MSSLHKIQISGIRSFSPEFDEAQTIYFGHPLTIILGRNGAGKTTIIEACLNATSGELPVGADRGSFVYDPRVLGEKEVRAQIRLTFRANTGQDIQVVRTLQSTVKKSKLTSTTIDASLSYKDATTKKTTSGTFRPTDIDKIIPDLLGICPPVLKNVIFCHQEDALWCFGTPLEVKKRLDDIFSSTKYVGALEKFRESAKFYRQEVKQCEASMLLLEEYALQAKKIQIELSEKENSSSVLAQEAANLEGEHKRLSSALAVSEKWFTEIAQYQESVSHTSIILNEKKQSIEALKASLQGDCYTSMPLSDLENRVHGVETRINELLSLKKQIENTQREVQSSISRIASELSLAEASAQKIEADIELSATKLEQFQCFQKSIGEKISFEIPFRPIHDIKDIVPCIGEALQTLHQRLDMYREEKQSTFALAENELHRVEAEQNELLTELSRKEVRKVDIETKILDEKASLEALQAEISKMARFVGESSLMDLKEELRMLQGQLQEIEESQASENLHGIIQKTQAEVEEAEAKFKDISDKMRLSMEVKDKIAKNRSLRSSKEEKEAMIKKNKTCMNELAQVPYTAHIQDVKKGTESSVQICAQNLEAIRKKIIETERSVATHEKDQTDLSKALQDNAEKASQMRSKFDTKLGDSIDITLQDPMNAMSHLDIEYDNLTSTLGGYSGSLEQYKRFIEHFMSTSACMVCQRGFENEAEAAMFRERLSKKIQDIEEAQSTDSSRMQAMKERKSILQNEFAEILHYIAIIQEKIPHDEARKKDVNLALENLYKQQADLAQEENQLLKQYEAQKQVLQIASEALRLEGDIQDIQMQLESSELADISEDDIDASCEAHKAMEDHIASLRKKIAIAEAARVDSSNALQGTRSQILSKENDVRLLEELFQKRSFALQSAKEKEDNIAHLKESQEALAVELGSLSQKLLESKESAKSIKRERDVSVQRVEADLANVLEIEKSFLTFREQASHLARDPLPEALQKAQKLMISLKKEREALEEREEQCRKEFEGVNAEYDSFVIMQQQFSSLRQIIHAEKELHSLSGQMTEVREKMQETEKTLHSYFESLSFGYEAKTAEEIKSFIEFSIVEIGSKISRLKGKAEPLEADVRHLRACLVEKKYDEIERRLASTKIKLLTSQIAVQDIEKFHKALDSAVTRYHMDKITELNDIIGQLWRSIYAGSDIDNIAIRVDEDNTSTMQRRSFRYRVVMCKGDFELDFRGRCSAGQKVLASVIIRLALSEAFCCDCGIMALDEPTTNLDEENIVALAEALRKLIEARRHVKNFQIIIITHDESFVRALGHSSMCDSYYYVHKTIDGKFSQIEKQSIQTLHGN